jgi:cytochrome c5
MTLVAATAACTVSIALHAAPTGERSIPSDVAGTQEPSMSEGERIARAKCLVCHAVDLIAGQRLTREAWGRELDKMVGWGAVVEAEERALLLDHLSQRYGDTSAVPSAVLSSHPGAAIATNRCLFCHDMNLIDQQRLTVEGWAREVEKMVGWGASVTETEKSLLVEYLATRRGVTPSP